MDMSIFVFHMFHAGILKNNPMVRDTSCEGYPLWLHGFVHKWGASESCESVAGKVSAVLRVSSTVMDLPNQYRSCIEVIEPIRPQAKNILSLMFVIVAVCTTWSPPRPRFPESPGSRSKCRWALGTPGSEHFVGFSTRVITYYLEIQWKP